ncbi:MAG: pilus assembly protein TadG-related protein [Dehalococcoidia bacterium]|nr:pilus assembly protein TadG-related protein [Dehalococcoidia bacterium]
MTRFLQRLGSEERGQAIVFVAVLMAGLVAVVGLVTDGGLVFSQRRDLQNVADAAALAGAMQLDEDTYRASGAVLLDEAAARQAAVGYLEAEGGLTYSVVVRPTRVEVSVSRQASTGFLRVVGINGVEISANASAEPRHGVASAAP